MPNKDVQCSPLDTSHIVTEKENLEPLMQDGKQDKLFKTHPDLIAPLGDSGQIDNLEGRLSGLVVSISDSPIKDDVDDDVISTVTKLIDGGSRFNTFGIQNARPKRGQYTKTYSEQVLNAKNRATSRTYDPNNPANRKTKIRISGYHITEQEFISSLVPTGEVDLNFLRICCVAIMKDSGDTTNIILDHLTIHKLLKSFDACDHEYVAALKKNTNLNNLNSFTSHVVEITSGSLW